MVFCMLVITALSHLPGKDLPRYYGPWVQIILDLLGPFHDKWVHLVIYFGLGMSAYKAFIGRRILHFSICAAFGLFDECHQYFVPGRHFDLMDWVADMVGILLALAFIATFHKPLNKYWCFS